MSDWFGFVNLHKPPGWTSRRAVDHVKPLVKPAKIGHAGTLDPLASGVLVLCVGPATRLVPYVHALPKEYRASFVLGRHSATDDVEGRIAEIADAPTPTRDEIEAALPNFIGRIAQVPPVYSAVKVRGQRAYELARRGKTPQLEPRTVEIESIRVLAYEHPRLALEILCGSGTYVRSIGRDLAQSLGTGAVMDELVRTRIGPFTLDKAVHPRSINGKSIAEHLCPPQMGLATLPLVHVTGESAERLQRGLRCPCPNDLAAADGAEVAVLSRTQRLIAIAVVVDARRELQPRHVFAAG